MPGKEHILAPSIDNFCHLARSSEKTLRSAKANQPRLPAAPRIKRNMTTTFATAECNQENGGENKKLKSHQTSA